MTAHIDDDEVNEAVKTLREAHASASDQFDHLWLLQYACSGPRYAKLFSVWPDCS